LVPPVEQLVQIGIRIAQGQAKVDDYLLLAYANAVERNFTAAQTRYSQALELGVKNKDFEGQAIAHNNLGEVSLATGNLKEAVSQITLAKDTYQRLGNGQRVSELNQRLVEINKLLQANPSQLQIDPSRIQIDPSRIQIDPSQIQVNPSRIQIQK
jgi:tetratricopeptide (TPR) repeat protein